MKRLMAFKVPGTFHNLFYGLGSGCMYMSSSGRNYLADKYGLDPHMLVTISPTTLSVRGDKKRHMYIEHDGLQDIENGEEFLDYFAVLVKLRMGD